MIILAEALISVPGECEVECTNNAIIALSQIKKILVLRSFVIFIKRSICVQKKKIVNILQTGQSIKRLPSSKCTFDLPSITVASRQMHYCHPVTMQTSDNAAQNSGWIPFPILLADFFNKFRQPKIQRLCRHANNVCSCS